jgi:DNA repair protein RecO (recombination protein O)
MSRLRTDALILRSVDFGESDRIVHLLVPDSGRLTAIARGARRSVKRFPGTLDLFNYLRIDVWRGRAGTLARLEQATLLRAFTGLRVDPARFALGCYLLELLDRLAPEAGVRREMTRLFEFAASALAVLEAVTPDARLRTLLELRALDALGLRPELSRCVRCGRALGDAAEVGFHVPDGGALCGACGANVAGLLRVHRGTLRALEQGLRFDLTQLQRLALGPAALAEARRLVGRFQRFHLGVDLRSERFLNEMLSPAPAKSV